MNKYNYTYSENDYKTPSEIYEIALKHLGLKQFTLDACCSDNNIPALIYFNKGIYDGLTESWEPYTWCNPPYNECEKWVKKAYKEVEEDNCEVAILLLPARTETKYWHEYILSNPCCQIQFLKKGYKFLNKDGEEMGIFKNPLALVYFMKEQQEKRLIT